MPQKLLKPNGPNLIQWDGTNLTELQTQLTAVVFVLTGSDLTADNIPVNLTDWVGFSGGAYLLTNAEKELSYQDIPADAEFAFTEDLEDIHTALDGIDVPVRQRKDVAVPGLLLGASQTLTCTFNTPMPSADYMISIVPVGTASIVDNVSYSVVGSSITANGMQIAVKAGLLIAVGTITLRVYAVEL